MFRKKTRETRQYDPAVQKPILRCSICNGEQVAGFKNLQTGKFEEVMFVRDSDDLEEFMRMYGLKEVQREY
ncbi:MAG: aspartate dehydrogenase [Lachnospiraceae bacterium]|nr:aspartate dehydrogenase [Lachnospiraceae bacterium]